MILTSFQGLSSIGTILTQGSEGAESAGYGAAVAIRGGGDARVFA